jgi:hypothetical protein
MSYLPRADYQRYQSVPSIDSSTAVLGKGTDTYVVHMFDTVWVREYTPGFHYVTLT